MGSSDILERLPAPEDNRQEVISRVRRHSVCIPQFITLQMLNTKLPDDLGSGPPG